MSDFNIPSLKSPLCKAITSRGLEMVKALARDDRDSKLVNDKRYDQILYYATFTSALTEKGGILDSFLNDVSMAKLNV